MTSPVPSSRVALLGSCFGVVLLAAAGCGSSPATDQHRARRNHRRRARRNQRQRRRHRQRRDDRRRCGHGDRRARRVRRRGTQRAPAPPRDRRRQRHRAARRRRGEDRHGRKPVRNRRRGRERRLHPGRPASATTASTTTATASSTTTIPSASARSTTTRARSPPASRATTWMPASRTASSTATPGWATTTASGSSNATRSARAGSCPYDASYAASHQTECSTSASQSQQCIDCLPAPGPERLRLLRLLRHPGRPHRSAGGHLHGGELQRSRRLPALHAGHPVREPLRTLRDLHRQAHPPRRLHRLHGHRWCRRRGWCRWRWRSQQRAPAVRRRKPHPLRSRHEYAGQWLPGGPGLPDRLLLPAPHLAPGERRRANGAPATRGASGRSRARRCRRSRG